MTELEIERVADEAIIIVGGFAFNKGVNGSFKILNLYNTSESCVLGADGGVISTNMNDIRTLYVQSLFIRNKEFLED